MLVCIINYIVNGENGVFKKKKKKTVGQKDKASRSLVYLCIYKL